MDYEGTGRWLHFAITCKFSSVSCYQFLYKIMPSKNCLYPYAYKIYLLYPYDNIFLKAILLWHREKAFSVHIHLFFFLIK